MARTLIVDAGFDGGNIIVHHVNGPDDIMLGINRDAHSEFYQWFHFRLSGARGVPCRIRITGLAGSVHPTPLPHRARKQ